MKVLLLGLLSFLYAATPPASICAIIAREVPRLRELNRLKEPGQVRVHSGNYAFDRFLGSDRVSFQQTSAVFLTKDGKHVVKMYPTGRGDWRGPDSEYWLSLYLRDSGISVPKVIGRPQRVAVKNLDAGTQQFLLDIGIKFKEVDVVVKEFAAGLTEAELRDREIPPAELKTLLKGRAEEKAKIQSLFTDGKFEKWLKIQGPKAQEFLQNGGSKLLDTENRNFILTEKGWVLFDP